MSNSCVQAVEMLRMPRGSEYKLCTLCYAARHAIHHNATIATNSPTVTPTTFPQAKTPISTLFNRSFSPLSTPPITTTTIYIN